MTRIIEKRRSLHKNLKHHQKQNQALQKQINQLQSLATVGTATFMIAHEINNLLTPLTTYASLALKNPEDKDLTQKALERATCNCRRASQVMQSILALADGQTEEKKDISLAEMLEEVFNCLCRDFSKDQITVKIEIPENLTLNIIPVQLQQVLMNLILNARDAMLPNGGILTITAQRFEDAVRVQISDTGTGIAPENMQRIFEPFFTTKTGKDDPSQHAGSGFGLPFCRQIIETHNGRISVRSKLGKGTTFTLTLPCSS